MPVKRLGVAKSRLHIDGLDRPDLALAFALDTVAAVLRTANVVLVIVVTDDARVRDALPPAPHVVIIDDAPDAGLNPALEHGARLAARQQPSAGIATVSSDLPALDSRDLERVLEAVGGAGVPAFVSDIGGLGTTVLATPAGQPFTPFFGRRSRAAHRSAGVREVLDAGRSVRRDVDTEVDLWDAERMGLGEHTRALLAARRSS